MKIARFATRSKRNPRERTYEKVRPILLGNVVQALRLQEDAGSVRTIVDATFGLGGHSRAILKHDPKVRLIALDADPSCRKHASKIKHEFGAERFAFTASRWSDMLVGSTEAMQVAKWEFPESVVSAVDGVLIDAGYSSKQIDSPSRGFSSSHPGPLDMRLNQEDIGVMNAEKVVSSTTVQELEQILDLYGEELPEHASAIASAVSGRQFECAQAFANVVNEVLQSNSEHDRPPAGTARTFMALRTYVNDLYRELAFAVRNAEVMLKPGGRLAVILFNSLETRVLEEFIQTRIRIASPSFIHIGTPFQSASLSDIRQNSKLRLSMSSVFERTANTAIMDKHPLTTAHLLSHEPALCALR